MSLPGYLEDKFSPEEIQFLVENEPIKIMPRITTRQKRRIGSGRPAENTTQWKLITTNDYNVNNMVAMNSTEVALWLALLLKQQGKCSIVAPSWLTLKQIDKFIEFEVRNPTRFANLPWNWLVIARLLFQRAPDDFRDPVHLLRGKVQDLREVRQGKIAKGLQYLNESHLQLDNLSLVEVNEMRPLVVGVMDKLKEVHNSTIKENSGELDDYDV
ncbi:HBR365Cp [Eremothecium sinecaudum]|uniref:DNA replication complex GINS protein PSF2 n=1 Tax=Eremothecium sinecaudum TaxID=45286 RepID=A0A125RE31_9SACH|nr:HBR365Cp [Eremothecium sinecaudum]AMD19266.1 HBR365Cp [Eremothecium sinecaudum]